MMQLGTPLQQRSASRAISEEDLLERVQEELQAYRDLGLLDGSEKPLISKWERLVVEEPRRFIRPDGTLDPVRLRNFRRERIFIPDVPTFDPQSLDPRNYLGGGRRGSLRMLVECLELLQARGYDALLKRYPCHPAGNPYVFEAQGYRVTHRWFKHIYFIGLLNEVLGSRLTEPVISLDIGSGYGIFSSLLRQEYPRTRCVLVDFPEQLLLALYFLGRCFPQSRVAGIREVAEQRSITRSFIEAYDFVLVPCAYYDRLESGAGDLVTNFASFGEMTPAWFHDYIDAPAFTGAKWLFTVNRIQSRPTYDTDLTVLDYPVWDPEKRLHFAVCPAFSNYYYERRRFVLMERIAFPPYFEYLGKI